MTPEIAICPAILIDAFALLAWHRYSRSRRAWRHAGSDHNGLLPADQAFQGFGSDTVIMILGLLIMAAGLIRPASWT